MGNLGAGPWRVCLLILTAPSLIVSAPFLLGALRSDRRCVGVERETLLSCNVSDLLCETGAAHFFALVAGPPLSDADRGDQSPFATGTQGGRGRASLEKKTERRQRREPEGLLPCVSLTRNRERTMIQHSNRLLKSLKMQIVRHDPGDHLDLVYWGTTSRVWQPCGTLPAFE